MVGEGRNAIKNLKIKQETVTNIYNICGKLFISFTKHSNKSIRKRSKNLVGKGQRTQRGGSWVNPNGELRV